MVWEAEIDSRAMADGRMSGSRQTTVEGKALGIWGVERDRR